MTLNTSRHSYFQVHIEHWYRLVIEKGYEVGGYSINQPNLIFFGPYKIIYAKIFFLFFCTFISAINNRFTQKACIIIVISGFHHGNIFVLEK